MSEFHPNRTKQIRTRPKLTARRLVECWPLLVWAAIGLLAWRIYASGVTFVRMNGAVDVYQENITPVNEERLAKILVARGDKVSPGKVVAVMHSEKYHLDLESLRRGIIADRLGDISDQEDKLIKLESELRELQTQHAEDSAIIKALESQVEANETQIKALPEKFRGALQNDPDALRAKTELAEAKGRDSLNATQSAVVSEGITRIKTIRDQFADEATFFEKHTLREPEVPKSGKLRDDEYQKLQEIIAKLDACEIKTVYGGTVDRIGKEEGEWVKPGDGILKIVGDPKQIVCFLPQDQANDVRVGDKVWVADTVDKSLIFETTVIAVSPRINNLADSTSPLPNRRVHGRDVVVAYPKDSIKDGRFILLPGQTVIVHLSKPGATNWFDTVLHNDDNDKVR